jgi:putative copper export protein
METLYQVLGLLGAGLIVWVLYRNIKGRPEQFSRENLSKSFSAMGILAVILIAFIGLLVFMLRHT